jgi:hypothetical protein
MFNIKDVLFNVACTRSTTDIDELKKQKMDFKIEGRNIYLNASLV